MSISFIGTGNVSTHLGRLLASAGHDVYYGSRTPSGNQLSHGAAIAAAEVVVLAIPFSAVAEFAGQHRSHLAGKVVVDATNVINLADWSPIELGNDSGGEQLSRLLPDSVVVKAFNAVFADTMTPENRAPRGIPLTVFVAGDEEEANARVARLATDAGFRALTVQGLRHARYLEAMAHLNISLALAGAGTKGGFTYLSA